MREERWPLSLVRKVERIVRDPVGKWQLSLSPEPEVDAILDAVFSGAGTSHVLEKAAPVCGDKRKRAPSTLLGTPAFVEAREEDSDVDVRPVKSQVRLRLFDSEEREDVPAPLVLSGNPIQISDSESPATPVSTRKLAKGRPKKKARRLQAATNVSVIEALEIELESCPDLTDLEMGCSALVKCPICADRGLDATHKVGSASCAGVVRGGANTRPSNSA
ncbi:hypothetical protein X777_12630 [Ooceraea biroi]|uniref:Uncharacterized protein n=1 Tax=Ooceraea biroi TaxID=2015173 RepID=A0A026VZI5_OOCBI|nr:hypothetical protein X777_12630 [Ooceraea biroi]